MCRVLGTPTEQAVTALPDFQARFPAWKRSTLDRDYAVLGSAGVDLLEKLLSYDPQLRIIGKEALEHPYFDVYDPNGIASVQGFS